MSVPGSPELAGRLAAAAPGCELAAVLDVVHRPSLSGEEAAAVLVAERRQAAHYHAGSLDTMVELGLRDEDAGPGKRREFPGEFAAEEPRALLCLTKVAAETEFWTGWALTREFPDVMAAFRAGDLDWPRARLFPDVLINLTPCQISVITGRVLPEAAGLTTGQLRARLQREAIAIDPAWRRRTYEERNRNRRVQKFVNGDGTADLDGRDMPLDEVAQAMANLTRLAREAKRAGDPRGLDAIRAHLYTGYLTGSYQQVNDDDIIADLLLHASEQDSDDPHDRDPDGSREQDLHRAHEEASGDDTDSSRVEEDADAATGAAGRNEASAPEEGRSPNLVAEGDVLPEDRPDPFPWSGREPLPRRVMNAVRPRAGIEVRVELSTLLGLDDRPGEIPGAGPVDAERARKIVARQTRGCWRFVLCDSNGYLVDTGIIRARPVGWLDFGSPITGAIVELALTHDLLQSHLLTMTMRSSSPPEIGPPGKSRPEADAVRASHSAWAPVLADILRRVTTPKRGSPPDSEPEHRPGPTTENPDGGLSCHSFLGASGVPGGRRSSGGAVAFLDGSFNGEIDPPGVSAERDEGRTGGPHARESLGEPERRLPRAGLRRRVEVRYRTCVAAGCRRPAAECEIDHREDYAKGGPTVEGNLLPLCKWHHRMKHAAGWRLTALDGHTFRWTTPNGNRVDVRLPPVIPNLPAPVPRE